MTQPKPTVLPGAVPVMPLTKRALVRTLTKRHPQMRAINALLAEREAEGIETYEIVLMAPNGRDFLKDAIEEAADLVQYVSGDRHLASVSPPATPAEAETRLDRLRLLHALVATAYNEVTNELRTAEADAAAANGSPF